MRVPMKFGLERLELSLPDAMFGGHWHLGEGVGSPAKGPEALQIAVEELARSGLPEAVRGRRAGLLLADGTRHWSPERLVPPLLGLLEDASGILAFLCTGTHDPETPENRALAERVRALLAASDVPAELVVNDCRRDAYVALGTTSRGTRAEIHARSAECDAFLCAADMKNHYFAGYSNPLKYLVPGIASFETARGNHSLALEEGSTFGRHPWHPDPERRANPLAEDMLEAVELVLAGRPDFALILFTAGDDVLWATGGRAAEAAARGMEEVDRRAGLRVAPMRYLVVSPGGSPHDESLYTAQRALELSRAAVLDGGEVLFLARCANGIGPPSARENFFDPMARPLAEIVAPPRSEYAMYSHKPVKFARYLERLNALHVLSDLPDAELERVHMRPARDAQAVVSGWVEKADPEDRIGFVDDASKFAVYAG